MYCIVSLVLTGRKSEGQSSTRAPHEVSGGLCWECIIVQLYHIIPFVGLPTAVDPKSIPKKCLMYHIRIYFLRMLTFNLSPL